MFTAKQEKANQKRKLENEQPHTEEAAVTAAAAISAAEPIKQAAITAFENTNPMNVESHTKRWNHQQHHQSSKGQPKWTASNRGHQQSQIILLWKLCGRHCRKCLLSVLVPVQGSLCKQLSQFRKQQGLTNCSETSTESCEVCSSS